jgi:hypothetical protein
MVGATGFEPVTTRTPSVCATRLRYAPTMGSMQAESNIPSELNQFRLGFSREPKEHDLNKLRRAIFAGIPNLCEFLRERFCISVRRAAA